MLKTSKKDALVEKAVDFWQAKLCCSTDVNKPIYREMAELLPPSTETRKNFKQTLTALIKASQEYLTAETPLSLTPRLGLVKQALSESEATMQRSDERLVIDFNTGLMETKTLRGPVEVLQTVGGTPPAQPEKGYMTQRAEDSLTTSHLGLTA